MVVKSEMYWIGIRLALTNSGLMVWHARFELFVRLQTNIESRIELFCLV